MLLLFFGGTAKLRRSKAGGRNKCRKDMRKNVAVRREPPGGT